MENARLSLCRPIIVLGIHRSGTSVVSDLVHRWGAYPGDPSLHREENDHNPGGFFEYEPLSQFFEDLRSASPSWIWSRDFRNDMRDLGYNAALRAKALEIVAGMEVKGVPWLWKDPTLAPVLPFWERIWRDPVYVVTVRNPIESSLSFEKMFLPRELLGKAHLTAYFSLLWQCTFLSILEHTERSPATLFLSYEDLLRSPAEQCSRLCDFLDRSFGLHEGGAERLAPMLQVVNPKLWRNRAPVSFDDATAASDEQKELYRYLLRRIEGAGEPFDRARYPLPACAREYMDNFPELLSGIDELRQTGPSKAEARPRRGNRGLT